MVPLWTVLIPACLLLTYIALAFETRPRVLGLLAAVSLALFLLAVLMMSGRLGQW